MNAPDDYHRPNVGLRVVSLTLEIEQPVHAANEFDIIPFPTDHSLNISGLN